MWISKVWDLIVRAFKDESMWIPLVIFAAIILAVIIISSVRDTKKLSVRMACITFVLGFMGYYYAYMNWMCKPYDQDWSTAIFHSIFSTIRMFIGNDDLATYVKFDNATPPKWVYTYLLPAFWAIHVLAITSTLLLVLEAFGKKLKQHVKLTFSLRKRIIICSVNKKSIAFAENALIKKDHKVSVVFLDDDVSKQDMETITKAGAYLINESPVNLKTVDVSSNSNDGINVKGFKQAGLNLCGKRSRLWWLRRKRNVEVFSFYEDEIMQYNLYKDIQQCANNIKYPTGKLSIFLHVEESLVEDQLDGLFKELNRKGSANEIRLYKVSTFSESQLSADILFSNHPLIEEKRRYFHKGLLDRDYMEKKKLLLVGFGFTGRSILKSAIHLGQFVTADPNTKRLEPTVFSADIVDSQCCMKKQYFYRECPGIAEQDYLFNLNFHMADTRSKKFEDLIRNNIEEYDYIIVTLGDDAQSIQTALEIQEIYRKYCRIMPKLFVKVRELRKHFVFGNLEKVLPFGLYNNTFDYDLITKQKIDTEAEGVRKIYRSLNTDQNAGELAEWYKTDFFTRKTNRAQVEYWRTNYEHMNFSGWLDENHIRINNSDLFEEIPPMVELMALIEHYRWNAFHLVNGWRTGCWKEFIATAGTATPIRHVVTGGEKTHKNSINKLHSCIVQWNELEEVGQHNGNRDFYMYDRAFALARLIRIDIEKNGVKWSDNRDEMKLDNEVKGLLNEWIGKFLDLIFYDPFGSEKKWKPKEKTIELVGKMLEEISKSDKSPAAKKTIERLQKELNIKVNDDIPVDETGIKTMILEFIKRIRKPFDKAAPKTAAKGSEEEKPAEGNKESLLKTVPMEAIAKKVHEAWRDNHAGHGWTYGEVRDDCRKKTPSFVKYEDLTEQEKEYDRVTAQAAIEALIDLGYDISISKKES